MFGLIAWMGVLPVVLIFRRANPCRCLWVLGASSLCRIIKLKSAEGLLVVRRIPLELNPLPFGLG